jgi:hypothetical protein
MHVPRDTGKRPPVLQRMHDPEDLLSFKKGGRFKVEWVISTARLNVLPRVHLPPINVVFFDDPLSSEEEGKIRLVVGFVLRCFQRLSLPNIATLRCPWRNNRHTSGSSTPVLSY